MLQNTSLCSQCWVRPNNTKMSEFGAEKVLLKGHARKLIAHALKSLDSLRLSAKHFYVFIFFPQSFVLFIFKGYFFFFIVLFYFTILYWFCHTSTRIRHGCTPVPTPEPPSHLPPHTISLGHPSASAPSILYPASNLDWWFVSYMILYMFQCHSPKSSHPLPLPQSP